MFRVQSFVEQSGRVRRSLRERCVIGCVTLVFLFTWACIVSALGFCLKLYCLLEMSVRTVCRKSAEKVCNMLELCLCLNCVNLSKGRCGLLRGWEEGLEQIQRWRTPMAWWQEKRLVYPRLYELMMKRLCIPASSATCERIFSKTGQLLGERRNRLSAKHVNELIFLHVNLYSFIEQYQPLFLFNYFSKWFILL